MNRIALTGGNCPQGKRPYPNGALAHREARKLRNMHRSNETLRPYRCEYCSKWHLANGHSAEKRGLSYDKRRQSRSSHYGEDE